MGLRSKKDKDQSSTNTLMSKADVYLVRGKSTDEGTFGELSVPNKDFKCFTLELPDRDNKPNISCILPKGIYEVKWCYSPSFRRNMYLLINTIGRSGIRIHSANYAGDDSRGYRKHLYGCIALGRKIGILDGQKAILVSKPCVKEFEKVMEYKDFILEIA